MPASSNSSKSKSWPSGVVYLRSPVYSKKLAKDAIESLVLHKTDLKDNELCRQSLGPCCSIKVTPISDPTHPACGQHGLFANKHLPPDSLIIPYLGFVHDKTEADETSDYDLSLDRELSIGIDAAKMGNEARFINDYRGVGPAPNAEFRQLFQNIGNGKVEKRMAVYVLSAGKSGKRSKGIAKGEEILVSYGKGFWTERQSKPV